MLRHVRSLYCRDTEYVSIITLLFIRGSFCIRTAYGRMYLSVIEKSSLSFCHPRMNPPITYGMHRVARVHFPFFLYFSDRPIQSVAAAR